MKKLILNTVLATAITAVSVSAFAGFSDPFATTDSATAASGFPGAELVSVHRGFMTGELVPSVMTAVSKEGQPASSMVYLTYDPSDKQFTYSLLSGSAAAAKDISGHVAFLVQAKQSSSSDASYVAMSGEVEKVGTKGKLVQFRFVPEQIKIVKAKVKGKNKRVSGSTGTYVFEGKGWTEINNDNWVYAPLAQ